MDNSKVKQRKKVCTKCGRKLWLRDYYRRIDGTLFSECKECNKKRGRDSYQKKKKVADGTFYHKSYDRIMVHNGVSTRIFWSPSMITYLQKHFPTSKNQDLADALGVSQSTMSRKARELRLEKKTEWLKNVWDEHRLMAHAESKRKGYPGTFKPGSEIGKEYRFKKKLCKVYENNSTL